MTDEPRTKKKSTSSSNVLKQQKLFEAQPITPMFAKFVYDKYLTFYEKNEIMNYQNIYYTGSNGTKAFPNSQLENNGFDNKDQNYILLKGDHLIYRYEIIKMIGRGCFSQVILAKDHKHNLEVAVKIWSSDERFSQLSKNEAKILQKLSDDDPKKEFHVVYMINRFQFRGHVCIVFPLLGPNLYYVLYRINKCGLDLEHVKRFTKSLVYCLVHLKKNGIIHCDLKPENIMLRSNTSDIEVADFGSSCELKGPLYTYIQTRHYRAPEVLFHAPYDCQIDIWSLGCIVYELHTSRPLLKGDDESDQVSVIFGCMGLPASYLIPTYKRWNKYVNENNIPKYCVYDENTKSLQGSINNKNNYRGPPASLTLDKKLPNAPENMLDFIKSCLEFDPKKRLNPVSALLHPFIRDSGTEAMYERMKYMLEPIDGSRNSGGTARDSFSKNRSNVSGSPFSNYPSNISVMSGSDSLNQAPLPESFKSLSISSDSFNSSEKSNSSKKLSALSMATQSLEKCIDEVNLAVGRAPAVSKNSEYSDSAL